MWRNLLPITLLGAMACAGFDPTLAEKDISEIVAKETSRLTATEIKLDLSISPADSIVTDSAWTLTRIKLNTSFESETLTFAFNQEIRNDTVVTVGDSAIVEIKRMYSGQLTATMRSDGSSKDIPRAFISERVQSASFADNREWEMTGYSLAEERSDTNTTQIFSLGIKGTGLDTIIYSSALPAGIEEFPKINPGAKLALTLRTVADTSLLICFALGGEAARFIPIENEVERWDDRWEAEVSVGSGPLVVGIIRKETLTDSDYPVDFDLWIIPISE